MTAEYRYTVLFVTLVTLMSAVTYLLLHKYSWGVTSAVLQQCPASFTAIFGSGFHISGLLLLMLVSTGLSMLVVRVFFSVLKAHQQTRVFAEQSELTWPRTLQLICNKYRIPPKLLLYTKSTKDEAYSVGLWHPKIIISRGLVRKLSSQQLAAVILHEWYHTQHRHSLVLMGGEVLRHTLFFLPFLYDVMRLMRYRFEVAADGFAIQRQQTTQYVQEALSLVQPTSPTIVSMSFTSSEQAARHRPSWTVATTRRLALSVCSIGIMSWLLWLPVSVQASTETTLMTLGLFSPAPRTCQAIFLTPNIQMSAAP